MGGPYCARGSQAVVQVGNARLPAQPQVNLRPSFFRRVGAVGATSTGLALRPNPMDFARAERDAA